ncbi:hypothetical protein JM18_005234 [Phytophthora kernoviae]|uniref:Calcineurin-like phosphoesterase domain-containing protein n=1 Tax=Phytophthora kernoviae TaxID=325452 RepID=A0A921V7V4_9STRA|nr:hypothetical protein JM18_005234 [Phytophthora kernoviae]
MVARKVLIIIGVVVVLAVIGVIVGVVVGTSGSDSASTTDGTSSGSSSGSTTTDSSGGTTKSSTKKKTTSTSSGSSSITSDPTSVTYSLAAFAIGDWGTTVTQDSCCTRSSTYNDYDINAEDIVADLMNQQAGDADVAPKIIISHGDNFYWTGINSDGGRDTRFTTTFEDKYDGDNIKTVPWVNVLGNHDYGGADYICSGSNDDTAACSSSTELVTALKNKFSWQSTYTSPNDDRWILEDHFYVYSFEDSSSGVSIDIFNVDSGDADTHGALQTCCQCYGYAGDDDDACANVARGDDSCCGGDTDMYDDCMAQFTEWSDDSRKQLEANIANSTATWKVVNSHYSPYAHYAEAGMTEWFNIINATGVHLWLNGHTHGENHDYSSSLGVHFVDNGAGGGIQKESASGIPTYAEDYIENVWTYDGTEYGFFSLTASEDWLKLQYHTADSSWSYAESFNSTTVDIVVAITAAVVILAIIGVIVGVLVARKSSDSASESSGTSNSGSGSVSSSGGTSTTTTSSSSGNAKVKSTTSGSSSTSSVTSDPTSAKFTLSAFAIGDWGTTVTQDSCCTRSSTFNDYDVNAEDIVANLMNQQASAGSAVPKCILSHGDNFYWTGIDSENGRDSRFTATFEGKYEGDNIKTIPWINVLGNHDYGGASYICSDGDNPSECSDADALVSALGDKFSWQSTYTSPNDDRWILKDHFYVYSIEDKDSGVSIDIFNVDAGDASTHGAQQTCCQCYGYAEGDDKTCKNVARGDKLCCGGSTDMYDACVAKFTEWSDDSRKQLTAEVAKSKATWKIVNSHYSPYAHYDETGMAKWFKILKDSGVQLWMNGHTHGENHDYSSTYKVHFVDNGAGGGIQKESASGIPEYASSDVEALWAYGGQEYGFMSVEASEEWLKLQYHSTDDSWSFAESFNSTKIGGVATKHCWYIPLDGATGKEC